MVSEIQRKAMRWGSKEIKTIFEAKGKIVNLDAAVKCPPQRDSKQPASPTGKCYINGGLMVVSTI